MAKITDIFSSLTEILEDFRYLELNSQVLTHYASPVRLNLSRIEDLENHYLSDETQNVFELVSEDLLGEIENIKGKLNKLRDSLMFDYMREVSEDKEADKVA